MSFQASGTKILLVANDTLVVLFSRVFPHNMSLQTTGISETLLAVLANMGQFTSVCSDVNLQRAISCERFPTSCAQERFLTSMRVDMHFVLRTLVKRSATIFTFKFSICRYICMCRKVIVQPSFCDILFAAMLTLETSSVAVNRQVSFQIPILVKTFQAHLACKWFLTYKLKINIYSSKKIMELCAEKFDLRPLRFLIC